MNNTTSASANSLDPRTANGNERVTNSNDPRFVNLCVCVYECESTGGAEWLLEDTIPLRNVSLPRAGQDTQIDLSYLNDTSFMQKRQRLTQVRNVFFKS